MYQLSPDVIIFNIGLHIKSDREFASLFDRFLTSWLQNPENARARQQKPFNILWKSQTQVGCGVPNKGLDFTKFNYEKGPAKTKAETESSFNGEASNRSDPEGVSGAKKEDEGKTRRRRREREDMVSAFPRTVVTARRGSHTRTV